MNVLEEICAQRRRDANAARHALPERALLAAARTRIHRPIRARLAGPGPHLIAEVKKASPSAGVLVPDYDPARTARDYEAHGAAAISVLTEPHRFLGERAHLDAVRNAVALPVLRKDFIVDAYQVVETAAWHADLLLLIVAALDRAQLRDFAQTAAELGLDVLAEAHDERETEQALELPAALVGVNSRDLRTLKTDLDVARRVIRMIPRDRVAVAESGIRTHAEVAELAGLGYRAFLVGESLLRSGRPGEALAELRGTKGRHEG